MANFEDLCYTCNQAPALIAKVLAGRCQMRYTRAAVGSGHIPEGTRPEDMTEVAGYVMDADIVSATNPVNGECHIVVQINSTNVAEAFQITGVLLYADDPDLGEIPYTYFAMENAPEWIYPAGGSVNKNANIDMVVAVGEVQNISVSIDFDALLTRGMAEQLIADAVRVEDITIPAIGWQPAEDYTDMLYLDIPVEDLTDAMIPRLDIYPFSMRVAAEAGFTTSCKTLTDKIRVYSVQAPTAEIEAQLTLLRASYGRSIMNSSAILEAAHNISVREDDFGLYQDPDTGYVYPVFRGQVSVNGIPLAATGGGTGGGGTGNNAVLTLTNTTGWLAKTISGGDCPLSFSWSSTEDDIPTGNGILTVKVDNLVKATLNIRQGANSVNVGSYLTAGQHYVKLIVNDAYDNIRVITYTITLVNLSISSSFDAGTAYDAGAEIAFAYTPVGAVEKTVHFVLDGSDTTVTVVESGRQQTKMLPAMTHGAHSLLVYFTANIDGSEVSSNELYYEIIIVSNTSTEPIITSPYRGAAAVQYNTLTIPYRVYTPSSLNSAVELYANGTKISDLTVDRTEQAWSYRPDTEGALALKIVSGTAEKVFNLTVAASEVEVSAVTNDLALHLSAYGRSNSEDNPAQWQSGDIAAELTGFGFVSDGWINDSDGVTALRVAGDARVTIPYQPFAQDFRTGGKTIEVEFSTSSVLDYNAVIFSCVSGERGIKLTAQKATFASEQSSLMTQYKENEHVRLSFVVQKRSENRLMFVYINGILSGAVQYPESDDFSQISPVNISIGSNDCVIDVYAIRIYDNDLTRYQILNNWIADTQSTDLMLARYRRNAIYDDYGAIVIAKLPADLPYLVLQAPLLPQYKGDKKTVSGYYVDPVNPDKSFTFEGAEANVQGTSSQYYARKNYKIKFKGGFTLPDDTNVRKYSLREGAIPVRDFCFKADVASSEGANNVELVRLYDDACPYRTPAQTANSAVRQGIDGFPIVIFHDDGSNIKFVGKYNFNNDKGTEEVFGFAEGDESWEIRNNTSNRVLWKSADFSGDAWLDDFEARYPEDNTDATRLRTFAEWLVSTDTEAASDMALAEAVTYGGVSYTTDSAAYRLAKFKAELTNYVELDSTVFYYLFTDLFLMVDSRAKNAFPSFIGASGSITKKVVFLPYDMDTALGINNEGSLVFGYELEDIDTLPGGADVYNGQQSVLWKNLRAAFFETIRTMYKTLRSTGALSYNKVEQMFEDHQDKWSEAIFNEDAYYKYLQPLIDDGSGAYLPMLQGSKAEQRKWWLYNRFRYIDSKYNAGDALTDVIQLRGYAKADITVTPYADVYPAVKYGSALVTQRGKKGVATTLICPLDNLNDTEIYIYSASQLALIGDLSGLKVGFADFSMATKLQSLKIGNGGDYSNGNLTSLVLGNNVMLGEIDVRNCPNLASAVDLSGCTHIEKAYFGGTSITSCVLPNGGILKELELPESVTNLTVRNQPLTVFTMPSYVNITTLRVENTPIINVRDILAQLTANSRVRIIGFDWTATASTEIFDFMDKLDTMRGLDEAGNNTENAQVSGTIRIDTITGAELAEINTRYPDISVIYQHIASELKYYNFDGSRLLNTETITDGGNGTYTGQPTRSATAQYTYTFAGWSRSPNGSANSSALLNVTADRNVYAAYTSTVHKYTVYFYNGSTLLQTVQNVPYGGSASYTEATPVSPDGSAEDYPFEGWSPAPTNIHGNTSCYAQFGTPYELAEIADDWDAIIASCADGTYATKYNVGNYKPLDLGSEGIINMQIVGKNKDALADGTGTAPLTWIGRELLATSHRMNPAMLVNKVNEVKYNGASPHKWVGVDDTPNKYQSTNQQQSNTTSEYLWNITPTADGSLTIAWTVDSEYADTLSIWVDKVKKIGKGGANSSGTISVPCVAGTPIEVYALYRKDSSVNAGTDTATITFSADTEFTAIEGADGTIIVPYSPATIGTGSIGGWEHSEMRTYYQNTLKPLIPEAVRSAIKMVTKTQYAYDIDEEEFTQTTQDDVWMPSYPEMFNGAYKVVFPDNASRVKMKVGASSASWWWLRSALSTHNFDTVHSSGGGNSNDANTTNAVALGFCL